MNQSGELHISGERQRHGAKRTRQSRGMQVIAFRAVRRCGSMLVETTIALSLLVFIALYLLKGSLNALEAGNWTIMQNITDAYLTYEKAYAEQVPFDELFSNSSDWALYPNSTTSTVTLGKMPGGSTVTGEIVRTRIPDSANLVADGGAGTLTTNPSRIEVWRLKSVLKYSVGGKNYRKVRTVVRTR